MPPLRVRNLWVGWQSSPSETGNDDRVCRPRDAFGREGVTPHPVSFPGLWVLGQVSSWPGSACLLPFGEVSASVTQVWKEGMTVCTSHPHRPSNSWSGCRPHPLVTGRDDLICRGWGRPRPGGRHTRAGLISRTPGFGGKHPLGEALPPFHLRGCVCQCDPGLEARYGSVY